MGLFDFFDYRNKREEMPLPQPQRIPLGMPPPKTDIPPNVQDILSRLGSLSNTTPDLSDVRPSLQRPDGLAPGLLGSGETPRVSLDNPLPPANMVNRPSLDNAYSPDNPPPAMMVPTNASPDNTTGMDYPAMPSAPSRVSLAPDPLTQKRQQLSVLSDPTNPNYKKPEKKHGFWNVLGEVGKTALIGAGAGYQNSSGSPRERMGALIGGAGAGAAAGAIDPSQSNQRVRLRDIDRTRKEIADLEHDREADTSNYYKQEQAKNIKVDNDRQAQQVEDARVNNEGKLQESAEKRKSVDQHVRLRAVQNVLNHLPVYDPNDPRFAEVTQAMKSVGIPIAPKDAKKNIKLVQDAETGAWSVILTNPIDGSQEVRDVKDGKGKILTTTPSVQVSTDAANARQDKQLAAVGERQAGQINAGNAKVNKLAADRAIQTLTAIEAGAPKGATPEQIQAKKDAYLKSLRPEVRELIP